MRSISEVMLIMKGIRNKKGISIGEATAYIEKETLSKISKKTLYGWEEGAAKPDIASFMVLCRLYGIQDIWELFEGESIYMEDVDVEVRDKLYRSYLDHVEYHEAIGILLGVELQKKED